MDHPPRRHRARAGRHRLAELDRGQLVALVLDDAAAAPGDRPRDPAPVLQRGVRGVGDGVDLELRDIGLPHLDLSHRRRD